jgi:isopenicillin-N N-acyltransferase-like protein
VVNVEGSATDAELTEPDDAGVLAHTNNYVCERMLRYEGDPAYAERSGVRYRRAASLLADAASVPGSITTDTLRAMLSDHANAPDSLCRHPVEGSSTKTVFWTVADVTEGRVTFGRGNPCLSRAQAYATA